MIRGRFAPTPSGPLHLGSLVTAVASYCDIKAQQGEWLLRIEDVDTPRVVKGSADNILRSLEAFGFEWDGEVMYQSRRFETYQDHLQHLIDQQQVYACRCTRKQLQAEHNDYGPLGLIYPGHCRHSKYPLQKTSLRLNLQQAGDTTFVDRHTGKYQLDLKQQVGDIVLKRIDDVYAYHLAVTIDDHTQGINQIVRGRDLLEVTPLHLYLNKLLGFNDAEYLHLPLVQTPDGKKLSKQTGAKAIDTELVSKQLVLALNFLGQNIPTELSEETARSVLEYAIANWNRKNIPPAYYCETTSL